MDDYPEDHATKGPAATIWSGRVHRSTRLLLRRAAQHRSHSTFLIALFVPAAQAQTQVQSQSQTMSFDQCIHTIQSFAGQYGMAPMNIIETADVRIVWFPTSDGSVLVTCSRPDSKMIITTSPHR